MNKFKMFIYLLKTDPKEAVLGSLVGISPYSKRSLKYKLVDLKKELYMVKS